MLYGKTPWEDCESEYKLILSIETLPLTFPYYFRVSDDSKSFIRGCLKAKESDRFSWDEALSHPLLNAPPIEKFKINEAKGDLKLDNHILELLKLVKENVLTSGTSVSGLFDGLDKNKDSVLSLAEFSKLIYIIKDSAAEAEIQNLFDFLDKDKSRDLTFGEFKRIVEEADFKPYEKGKDPFLERKAVDVLNVLRDKIQKAGEDLNTLFNALDKVKI